MAFTYTRIETADGSPSLRLSPEGEPMHSLDGAFTETQYIYQPTVEKAFLSMEKPSFLSLGLGLGYNEILIACEALKNQTLPSLILSYESVVELRQCFRDWLQGHHTPLNQIYEEILQFYSEKYQLPLLEIKKGLTDLLESKNLILAGAIEKETLPPPCNAILFDAFSSKTSPQLWSEDFLNHFFKNAAAEKCFVSTYACTGDLRRALKINGFTLEIKKGFGLKRESTSATKSTPS
jgi:tRNA U34 5-methylaminomethyl-2-thiouridine-forming methyltransferase MnmC